MENTVEPDRPQMTIWRVRSARYIPKATNRQSKYLILIAFPLQQWLQERTSTLRCRYIACVVLPETINIKIQGSIILPSFLRACETCVSH